MTPTPKPSAHARYKCAIPERIELGLDPRRVLAHWPRRTPLAVLWSGGPVKENRWIVLGRPARTHVLSHGASRETIERVFADAGLHTPMGTLIARPSTPADIPEFAGGVIGFFSYELGVVLEPKASAAASPWGEPKARAVRDRPWPLAVLHECPDALVYDRAAGVWWGVGAYGELVQGAQTREPAESCVFRAGALPSDTGQRAYMDRVARVLEYIRAGDCYQVNLAHRLSAEFLGSPRALFAALMDAAEPWYGAYLEHTTKAIASASPELFLRFCPATRTLTARPMKGTRPALPGASEELEGSAKDRAELAMIVDLMRNDVGRVSELGSVRVAQERRIELHGAARGAEGHAEGHTEGGASHAPLLQATAAVTGVVREGVTRLDMLRACFPCGSVTGAPKIRAMQIIDELETHTRGPYCGSVGFFSASGHAAFNVAIRTACIDQPAGRSHPGTLDWHVGGGIVADSDPRAEWQETLDKSATLRAALGAPRGIE